MDIDTAKYLIKWFTQMGNKERDPITHRGICNQMPRSAPNLQALVDLTKWPEYSGNKAYPIPSFNKKYCPEQAYEILGHKWIRKSGACRRRLCLWVANELQEELDRSINKTI